MNSGRVAGPRIWGTTRVVERELKVTVDFGTGNPDGRPVLRVAGEIDIETSPALEEQLQAVLDEGHTSVLVDLGQVTFLDSTGLSALIGGLRRCQGVGGELRLVSPRANVRKVLEVTGLVETFHVDDETAAAAD